MKMNKLATLFLTSTLALMSGAALAASNSATDNNELINAAADEGMSAPTVTPKASSGGTMLHPEGAPQDAKSMNQNDAQKNSTCKDGKCADNNQ